ncbi:MAG: hypothetical protein JWR02_2948 [Mucilaginibacter sp.]|nr:hypothetical protein [Mucilaginibacter sp.]
MTKRLTIDVSVETKLAMKVEAKRRNLTVSQLMTLLFLRIVAEDESKEKISKKHYNANSNRSIYSRDQFFFTC